MRRLVCALVPALVLAVSQYAEAGDASGPLTVADFTLSDLHSQSWSLRDVKEPVLVVAFVGTECPLAKLYAPRLAKIAREYQGKGVAFVAIDSNIQDSLQEISAFARTADIAFPVLRDAKNQVADRFGATRTPEVFVLDQGRTIRYQGRIDDQYGVGVVRTQPHKNELKAAVDAVLRGQTVSTARAPAVGCLIGRARQPQPGASVTFSKQISRLFNKRCVECHHSGDIAPFALTSYEDASAWADMIAEVVDKGRMPPWHADPKYGEFADDRRLTDEEKHLIHAWVDAGAPQGDPKDAPPVPTFPQEGWHFDRAPDLIIPISKTPYRVKAEGVLRYQHFRVPSGFKEGKWIEAVEVQPGNRAVVHHVLVHVRQGRVGGNGVAGQGFLAAYVPGLRPTKFREGTAKRVSAGSMINFQIHYTPNGSEQDDLTRLGLWFADPAKVTHELRTIAAANMILAIPPGAENHPIEATTMELPAGSQILAYLPHMHLRGKAFKYEALYPDGKRETLLDVPHYDFNWQTAYRLKKPLSVPEGTKIHAIAHFDNSENNLSNPNPKARVFWGDQTFEEMMIGYFDLATPRRDNGRAANPDADALRFAASDRAALQALVVQLDANQDGNVTRNEVPPALRGHFDRFAKGRDSITLKRLQALIAGDRRRGAE